MEISPEGDALLENIGPVNLSGLKLNDAKNRLKSRLKNIYTGISTGKTSINISVGIPRAIRINIAGEVQLPGTYNFSAFNTLYNALYVAGGVTEDASLRDIRLYRNNKLISSVDVYDFLKSGLPSYGRGLYVIFEFSFGTKTSQTPLYSSPICTS